MDRCWCRPELPEIWESLAHVNFKVRMDASLLACFKGISLWTNAPESSSELSPTLALLHGSSQRALSVHGGQCFFFDQHIAATRPDYLRSRPLQATSNNKEYKPGNGRPLVNKQLPLSNSVSLLEQLSWLVIQP